MAQRTPRSTCTIHFNFPVEKKSGDDKEWERNIHEQLIMGECELKSRSWMTEKTGTLKITAIFLQLTYNNSMLQVISIAQIRRQTISSEVALYSCIWRELCT